ncbi:MAG: hypothetical protein HY689_04480 [Chloroflexi bacterium]|nr:hypothetical protein [Chloroflexota bacterium]
MDCAHVRELLHHSLDGLPTDSALRDHLARCSGCRTQLADLLQTARLLGRLRPVVAPPTLLAEVMVAVQERHRARTTGTWRYRVVPLVAAVAALLGVLLLSVSPFPVQPVVAQEEPTPILVEGVAAAFTGGGAVAGDLVPATSPTAWTDLVTVLQALSVLAESAGFLLGLCCLFIAGAATLIELLTPDPRRAVVRAARSP